VTFCLQASRNMDPTVSFTSTSSWSGAVLINSTPIYLFFSLLDAMVAERACPKFGQLLAQFLKQVNEYTLLARMESLHGLLFPSG